MPDKRRPDASTIAPAAGRARGGAASGVAGFGDTGFGNTGFGTTGFGNTVFGSGGWDGAGHEGAGHDGTGFGPTVFDALPAMQARGRAAASALDVCHVGVVLRALLFVHAVLALGTLFTASGFSQWVVPLARAAGSALPGVLLWLLAACGLKRVLAPRALPVQAAAAVVLGALCGVAGAAPTLLLASEPAGTLAWLAPALAGAAFAAALFAWLHLRAQATLPADTAARLAELQSRIRPHFLFNTLNTALALVRLDPARAEDVLEDLAELFRVAISDAGESVSLAEEIALAQRYLAIEQIRFGDRLKVVWELDPAAGAARVPPLLLQPLVENAVRHGIEPSATGGLVRVRTRAKGSRALVSIANSVPAAPSRPGHGIALRNVRERLRLMHDVAAQFQARGDGPVWRVQIGLPLESADAPGERARPVSGRISRGDGRAVR
jgi:two-component system sensor histidine kinase AlgZ